MFKKTIQKTVSVVVMLTMLSSHIPVVQAETEQERKQRIFNEAKSFGVSASQTTSSGITGGFTTPDGSTYGANDIPGGSCPDASENVNGRSFGSIACKVIVGLSPRMY